MFSLPSAAQWRSIRWTLPLLIVSLLLVVVATLDIVARSQLRRVVLDATGDRLRGVTAQLATLMGESVNRAGAELAAAAADPAFAAYLQRRRPDDSARALRALRDRVWIGTTPPRLTELRTRTGERALRVGDSSINDVVPRGVGPIRQSDTLLHFARAVPVVASGDTVGWLVQHRVVTGQGVAAVRALIGSDADVLLGNADATLWSDWGKVVPGPPASALNSDALTMYDLPDGVSKVGMARAIPGTPWMVWTELPTRVVMAPVRRFLRRLAVATVIVITADVAIRTLARRILAGRGYNVLEAADGISALALAERCEHPADLLLTDIVMPGINGRELTEQLTTRWPDMRTVYMTGYTDDEVVRSGVRGAQLPVIQKPFTADVLAAKVRAVFDRAKRGPGP